MTFFFGVFVQTRSNSEEVVQEYFTERVAQWLSDRLPRCVSRVRSPHGTNICISYSVRGLAVCVYDFSMFLTPTNIPSV